MGGLVGAGPAGGAAGATWSARPRRRGSSATRCSCGRHDESDGNRQLLWSLGHKFSSGASGLALATMVAFSAPDALAEVTRQDTSVVETQTTTISEEIKGPASVVKDCRTDSPDLQTVYWVSSRSVGQNPTLYAIDKDGKIIGDEYQVQTRNVGQEEIVFVHRQRKGKKEDFIVLADTSNKFKNRDQLAIYEIAPSVPTAADDQVSPPSSPSFPSSPPLPLCRDRFCGLTVVGLLPLTCVPLFCFTSPSAPRSMWRGKSTLSFPPQPRRTPARRSQARTQSPSAQRPR